MSSALVRIGRSTGLAQVTRPARRMLRGQARARSADASQRRVSEFSKVVAAVEAGAAPPKGYPEVVARAVRGLHDPRTGEVSKNAAVRSALVDQFHRLYYHSPKRTWKQTFFNGTTVWKCPLDLWLYQEIMAEVKPDLIIETGTAYGGSAYYMAALCDFFGRGQIVSIDISHRPNRPEHPRITYLTGSSTDPEIVAKVEQMLPTGGRALVILDSDHSRGHVIEELKVWNRFVCVGSYLIVEDSNINDHPVFPRFGPGPMEAIDEFLASNEDFVIDETKHKFFLTFNPRGFLRRISQ